MCRLCSRVLWADECALAVAERRWLSLVHRMLRCPFALPFRAGLELLWFRLHYLLAPGGYSLQDILPTPIFVDSGALCPSMVALWGRYVPFILDPDRFWPAAGGQRSSLLAVVALFLASDAPALRVASPY